VLNPRQTWYETNSREAWEAPAACGKLTAHTCVVGGGLAGVSTALGLAERGHRGVVLLEADRVGSGASGRNGGFVFGGFSVGPFTLAEKVGLPAARRLYRGTLDAVGLLRQRIERYRIDCDMTHGGVLWAHWFREQTSLESVRRRLSQEYDVEWEHVSPQQMRSLVDSPRYHGGLREPQAFHVQPLALVRGLARAAALQEVRLFERSPVLRLEPAGVATQVIGRDFSVEAKHVVVAGGGYLTGDFHALQQASLPIATYVMVTEPLGDRLSSCLRTNAAIYDSRFAFDYYHLLADNRLLWGGRISVRDREPSAVARLLSGDLNHVYPQLGEVRVDHAWSGLMGYARHEMPQIGQMPSGVWYSQGFGGHGLAPTTLSGELIAAAICGDRSPVLEDLRAFGLTSAWRHSGLGLLGAQARYSWLQLRDAWRTIREC
jgi:gamma-glutamylputrescine oxidase